MKLAFIGHSIVYGYPYDKTKSFPYFVARELGCETLNFGVSGESTEEICRRFEAEALSSGADTVFLMAGTNDYIFRLCPPETSAELCRRMRHMAEARGVRFVHLSPLPIDAELAQEAWVDTGIAAYKMAQEDLAEFTELLRRDAEESGCGFIDCFHEYASCGRFLDGVHPTTEGQLFLAQLCVDWLRAH